MTEQHALADHFEENRAHLRAVAYRMLGSLTEAEDAVQEAWLRLSRSDTTAVQNLGSWLTTVVARVCLDMLRSRKLRREEPISLAEGRALATNGPAEEAALASSVGLALLVILELLDPAERLAFVLHDMFAVPFDEIAQIVGRTPEATRQLASRARRRVQGGAPPPVDVGRQREVVTAFLAAARGGDMTALLALLAPDVVMRADPQVGIDEVRGATEVAGRAIQGGARTAQIALVDGAVGVVIAPMGKLMMVLAFTIDGGQITQMEAIADPERLRELELTMLG